MKRNLLTKEKGIGEISKSEGIKRCLGLGCTLEINTRSDIPVVFEF